MNKLLSMACLILAFSSAYAKDLPDNVYYLTNLTISENESRINFIEIQMNMTDDRFRHFTESLGHKNKLVAGTLFNEQRNYTAIGFTNSTNQRCIIHYGKLPEVTEVQGSINGCVKEALLDGEALFRKANKNLESAKFENHYIRRLIENCNSGREYEVVNCANSVIQKSNFNIRYYLEQADKEFQRALASYDDISKQAVECTYQVVKQFARDIEDVRRTVTNCQKRLIKA
ncbi:hypothetical protein ACFFRR_004284 [Megaselia abdita]